MTAFLRNEATDGGRFDDALWRALRFNRDVTPKPNFLFRMQAAEQQLLAAALQSSI